MNKTERFLFFILLPILALISYPPALFASLKGIIAILLAIILIGLLGWMVSRGRTVALTLLILSQGFNVIIRMMMFFPNSVSKSGIWNLTFAITCLLGIALSYYLLLRLDRPDVRSQMIT